MRCIRLYALLFCGLLTFRLHGQPPAGLPRTGLFQAGLPPAGSVPIGRFLTDSIEVGRPFQYSLTYYHAPTAEVLFPDTAHQFAPFRVEQIAVFPTLTTGEGQRAISRDSAVYTLLSFETMSAQTLQTGIRLINARDCTLVQSSFDTVWLRSRLLTTALNIPLASTLATDTTVVPLRQQFNYPVLGVVLIGLASLGVLLYVLFGRAGQRQWRLYRLRVDHARFLREYNRLSRSLNPDTAAETANQSVIVWKAYLEKLERQPYASLTTPEIAERTGDNRVADALREADRMIYGGAFSARSPEALRILADVATQTYHRRRVVIGLSRSSRSLTTVAPTLNA